MLRKYRLEELVIFLVVMLGALLAVAQFIYNRSLWLDEAMLALNIVNKSSLDLLRPLDYYQVCPILFLEVEKFFSTLIPHSEIGLRIFPLITFLLSLFFFYRVTISVHTSPYTILLSLSLFVFNPPLIYYASEVKQYMGDVLLLTTVYYLLLKEYQNKTAQYYYLGIAGIVGIFLSDVAPVILLTAGIYLLYQYLQKRKSLQPLMVISVLWSLAFLIYFYCFIYQHPSRELMADYWSKLNAFSPLNPFSLSFYKFLWDKWGMLTTTLFQFGVQGKLLLTILVNIGVVHMIRKKRIDYLILTLMPLTVHLILSGLRLYPFDARLLLYTCPAIIMLCAFGWTEVNHWLFSFRWGSDRKIERSWLLTMIIPLWFAGESYLTGFYGSRYPFQNEEVKSSLNFITQNKNADDRLYVYWGSSPVYHYYKTVEFFNISDGAVTVAQYDADPEEYVKAIADLSGAYWLLFSHADNDEQYIVGRLTEMGFNKKKEFKGTGSSAYLFDLR